MDNQNQSQRIPGEQDSTKKWIRSSRTISGQLHDEIVMMDLEQGKYFSLNPVASRIWDLLDRPLSVRELCRILIDEYDVEPERCLAEVWEYIIDMARLGLIRPA